MEILTAILIGLVFKYIFDDPLNEKKMEVLNLKCKITPVNTATGNKILNFTKGSKYQGTTNDHRSFLIEDDKGHLQRLSHPWDIFDKIERSADFILSEVPEGALVLDLVLIQEWYKRWLLDKTEDYRELTSYWFRRLFVYDKKISNTLLSIEWDKEQFYKILSSDNYDVFKHYKLKPFEYIRLSNGMSKNRPTSYVKFGGVEIRTGKEEWGAKKDRLYFCIKAAE